MRQKILLFTKIASLFLFFPIFILGLWSYSLNKDIKERLKGDWFAPPVEIYSSGQKIFLKQHLNLNSLITSLKNKQFRERSEDQRLYANDFSLWSTQKCQEHVNMELDENIKLCLILKHEDPMQTSLIVINKENQVVHLFAQEPFQAVKTIQLNPQLFAQLYAGKPIMRRVVQLGQVPLYCSQAVTAIEDKNFLSHKGISPIGLLRAVLRNLIKGKYAQGGSTITQQLVKNYFLTSEKTIKRKITELIMAVLLEAHVDKDQILTSYLNVIYMGQNGPFEVRGFAAASRHYFLKEIESLNLQECALLAALLNSPGRFDPFRHPERSKERRNLVLKKMSELNMISEKQKEQASLSPLPQKPPKVLDDPAPYFVQAIFKEIDRLGIAQDKGLRIYTSLNPEAQDAAQKAVANGVRKLETKYKHLTLKKQQGLDLESLLISVDLQTGGIDALVGGRSYKLTQYNRAIEGHRQVGSIMKPFVYLSALESKTTEGLDYTPLTSIIDEKFEYKYDGQSWSPKNYEKKFYGKVPLYYALKSSLNAATAKLGIEIGLEHIIDIAKRLDISSDIKAFPSLTLGAFELYPLEVAQSYATIARMGNKIPLHFIQSITDLNNNSLYSPQLVTEQKFAPETIAVLIGMMKQTVRSGTARSLSWRGFAHPAAGKTGTTSDTKDAWFVGFTPYNLTLVWVGYDKNEPHELTGASGALPIWAEFMKKYASQFPADDFSWPEGTIDFSLTPEQVRAIVAEPNKEELEDTSLIFRRGNEPR